MDDDFDFADDAPPAFDRIPTIPSLRLIKNCLEDFGKESGLIANIDKSKVFFGGLSVDNQRECSAVLRFSLGSFPIKYLGAPLHSKKLLASAFDPLLNRIKSVIQNRSARKLSYAGRAQIIRAIIEGVVSFWMKVIFIPKKVVKRINSICRAFLWAGEVESRRCLVAWTEVCRPLVEGGLNFKELLSWNDTLMFHLMHDLHMGKVNLWTMWARKHLTKEMSVWQVEARPCSSFEWKHLVDIKDRILELRGDSMIDDLFLSKSNGKMDSHLLYDLLRNRSQDRVWCDVIWNGAHPKKWSFIGWLATLGRLPTASKLHRWGLIPSASCVLCHGPVEDESHLWFGCHVVNDVAHIVFDWQGIRFRGSNLLEWWTWFAQCNKRSNNIYQCKLLSVLGIIYHTWRLRIDVIFRGNVATPAQCAAKVIEDCKLRIMHKMKTTGRRGNALRRRLRI